MPPLFIVEMRTFYFMVVVRAIKTITSKRMTMVGNDNSVSDATVQRQNKHSYPNIKYPTQLANMSFDQVLDLTANVFHFRTYMWLGWRDR